MQLSSAFAKSGSSKSVSTSLAYPKLRGPSHEDASNFLGRRTFPSEGRSFLTMAATGGGSLPQRTRHHHEGQRLRPRLESYRGSRRAKSGSGSHRCPMRRNLIRLHHVLKRHILVRIQHHLVPVGSLTLSLKSAARLTIGRRSSDHPILTIHAPGIEANLIRVASRESATAGSSRLYPRSNRLANPTGSGTRLEDRCDIGSALST